MYYNVLILMINLKNFPSNPPLAPPPWLLRDVLGAFSPSFVQSHPQLQMLATPLSTRGIYATKSAGGLFSVFSIQYSVVNLIKSVYEPSTMQKFIDSIFKTVN